MKFYRHLYRTSNIREMEIPSIRRQMARKKLKLLDFAICIDETGTNQLVIYSGFEWNSPRVNPDHCAIIGIGRGYFQTQYLIMQMVKDAYLATGDARLIDYFYEKDPSLRQKRGGGEK